MPSGNADFTYTGDEPEITVADQTFMAGELTHVIDNGIITLLRDRDDFVEGAIEKSEPKPAAKKAAKS